MRIRFFSHGHFLSLLFLITVLTACKKDSTAISPATQNSTRTQLSLDSIFLYAKETYLWNDALPTYEQFNPRKYTSLSSELLNLQKELFDITQFKINSSTNLPYEYVSGSTDNAKYSFISTDATNPAQKKSTVTLDGAGNDFGFALTTVGTDDIRVRYVNPGSPADLAGMLRGYRVVKINGRTFRADIQADIDFINSAFNLSTMTLNLQITTRRSIDVTLTKGSYTSSPIFKKAILTAGSKQAGYLAYARFSTLQNSQAELDAAFSEFSTAGIADIIIDLRYNGGGYVETAQYLTNLIAPSGLSGSVMYTEYFNQMMQNGKATILSKQPILDANNKQVVSSGKKLTYADVDYSVKGNTHTFAKKGTLNSIKNVYFIVSASTASASELVINNLKPYLNVVLIGVKSYGKPVGFFGLRIDKYTVYMSQFQSRNSAGQGDYFDGFEPDFFAIDDVTRDFGNVNEICLAQALALIKDGTTSTANSVMSIEGEGNKTASTVEVKNIGADNNFNGMIEDRIILK
jgi:carboxyl-terminal processing protease